jgi:hypothetical protein
MTSFTGAAEAGLCRRQNLIILQKSGEVSGGNITGMANMVGDAIGNGVELLQTILPSAKRIARGSWLGIMSERPAPIFP